MNAEEARQLSENFYSPKMDEIYSGIGSSARKGLLQCVISVKDIKSEIIINRIMKELEKEGYIVKRQTYSDFREAWDNIHVSWEK